MSFVRPASRLLPVLPALLLLHGFYVPVTGGAADARAPEAPRMQISVGERSLSLSGDVSSTAHEVILRRAADTLFAGEERRLELRPGTRMPPGWALTTELALQALAQTRTADADIHVDRIVIRGVTTDAPAWRAAVARLERHLLPGMRLEREVIMLAVGASHEELCRRQFEHALGGRDIGFARSSRELGSAARPLLDELVELAVDCPAAIVQVTGHSGEAGDTRLAEARARAVAAYMIERGIPAERLVAAGAGAAQRRLPNGQIEIRVRFR